jgi:hypothetical protein
LKLRLAKQGFEQHEFLKLFNPILFLAYCARCILNLSKVYHSNTL